MGLRTRRARSARVDERDTSRTLGTFLLVAGLLGFVVDDAPSLPGSAVDSSLVARSFALVFVDAGSAMGNVDRPRPT